MIRSFPFVALALRASAQTYPCDPVELSNGIACRCTEDYCDKIDPLPEVNADQVAIYTSDENGLRLQLETVSVPESPESAPWGSITLELDGSTHQEMLGFGGAFTDAAAYVISFLPESAKDSFFESYFSRTTGAGYSMCRTHVGSVDFSRTSYSLVQGDSLGLEDFQLMDDDLIPGKDYKVDFIRRAMQEVENTSETEAEKLLQVFASIWSIPVFMKTCDSPPAPSGTNSCEDPTFLLGALKDDPEVKQAYANYWVKFVEAYKDAGIDLWGATVNNEPDGNPTGNGWENTYYTPETMNDFVENFFGPTLKGAFPDFKLMNGDDQYPLMPEFSEDASNSAYLDGVGYHWYYSFAGSLIGTGPLLTELVGGQVEVRNAYQEHNMNNRFGNQFLLMTEACTGYLDNVVEAGSWERGYNYMTSILHEVESGAAGWVDWNLALDMQGGPNHADNQVDAPILVDTENGVFYKNPMYYAMAHYSKFVPPGAIRLGLANSDIGFHGDWKALEAVAFRKSASSTECVLVIANDHLTASLPARGASADKVARVVLPYGGREIIVDMPDNTFKTIVFHCPL